MSHVQCWYPIWPNMGANWRRTANCWHEKNGRREVADRDCFGYVSPEFRARVTQLHLLNTHWVVAVDGLSFSFCLSFSRSSSFQLCLLRVGACSELGVQQVRPCLCPFLEKHKSSLGESIWTSVINRAGVSSHLSCSSWLASGVGTHQSVREMMRQALTACLSVCRVH